MGPPTLLSLTIKYVLLLLLLLLLTRITKLIAEMVAIDMHVTAIEAHYGQHLSIYNYNNYNVV